MGEYISYIDDESLQEMEAQKERADMERRALVEAMGAIMQTPSGQHIVRWIVQTSGAFVAAYCSTLSMAQYREGRRSLGMDVLKLCQDSGTADKLLQSED